jgi:hypothetical protein
MKNDESAYAKYTLVSAQSPLHLLSASPMFNFTDQKTARAIFVVGKQEGWINERNIMLDAPPYVKEGTTMIPLRMIGEMFGSDLKWDPNTKKVLLLSGQSVIELTVGKQTAVVNSFKQQLK